MLPSDRAGIRVFYTHPGSGEYLILGPGRVDTPTCREATTQWQQRSGRPRGWERRSGLLLHPRHHLRPTDRTQQIRGSRWILSRGEGLSRGGEGSWTELLALLAIPFELRHRDHRRRLGRQE